MNDFNERIANLSEKKRALLEAHLKGGEGIVERAIPRRPEFAPAPLSFAQQRLWFLDQLEPGSPFYNMPAAFHLKGALDIAALEKCFSEILRRHEVLRTRFIAADGEVLQVIQAAPDFELSIIDLASLAPSSREAEALRFAHEEAAKPFSLSCGPVFRAHLAKLAADDHVLTINLHHIASDNLSKVILYRELGALYEAFSSGSQSPLTELPIQYADYALWQRERLKGRLLDEQLAYWKAQLKGAPALLELPIDRPRPQIQKYHGAHQTHLLARSLLDDMKTLSQANGATLFMTLLTVFKLLLARYTLSEDILVATPAAGRTRIETENLIGFFVNTLVLRTNCSNNPSFTELLARVRATCLEAYSHQDMPFEKLVEELKPDRSLSYAPLVQVMFGQRLAGARKLSLRSLDITLIELASESATFDLYMGATETADGLYLSVEYNTGLFDEPTITRLLGHYQTLLEGIVANPEQRLSALPILTAAERHQLLVEWNNTATNYPNDRCVQQLFEAQVEKTPNAIAVVFQSEELTYAELNQQANRLSHHLITLGVGPEVLVALCVERSLEMVVALLGILKAGGAYLPLDPAYPKERLAFMLKDAQGPVLLTQQRLRAALPEHSARLVLLDADDFSGYPASNRNTDLAPDNLAYVIYTSGSAGQPKGAMNTHRGIVNRLLWMQDAYRLNSADRVLQKTPFSFDVSVWEFFWPLLSGARLVVARPGGHQDSAYLVKTIIAGEISTLHFVPSMLQVFLAEHGVENCRCLKRVICSGEALPFELQQRFFERLPAVELHNLYGPTEAAVDVTFWACDPASKHPIVPIGRPIANTGIYILDRGLQPTPVGLAGELHIGGAGLARGYLNRPELTAEKFIANPFSDEPGARLYKTGDLARYLPDGNIEFLGRLDTQVKVRGFRIELGEIETVLNQHPGVKACAVLAREDAPGDKRLVAYVVGHKAPAPGELRDFLREKLAEYMLPSAFVMLDHLPLTPNGKLDRKALPAPEDSRPDLDALYVAARTPTEETLAAIWAEVLKLDQVGIHDNFFDLGGHSLLAAQLISRVREQLDIDLPLRAIFEAPTVESLAAQIASAKAPSKRAIAHRRKRDSAPVSIAQARLLFLDQLQPNSSVYNVPAGFWIEGLLDVRALAEGLGEIVRRHEALRTSFANAGDEPVQVIQAPRKFELPVIDLMDLPAASRRAEVLRLSREDARAPFDLASGPLLRAKLVRLTDREYLFILNVHHIVFDGWSRGVLYRELSELYRAYRSSKPSPLLELPIQYADFAVWQRCVFGGNTLDEHLAYWKRQLGGALPVLELPLDRLRPAVQDHDGACELMTLPESLTDALRSLKNRKGVTLFTLLLAAFQLLLYRLSGQDDIVLGVPVAGRNRIDTEALIGFFISTVAIRADLFGNPSFLEYLDRVRKITLDAYDHQDVPFERLVEELRPARSTARNPIFDVLINFISNRQVALPQLDDLATGSLETHETESKFSMTLYIREEGATLKLALAYQTALFSSKRVACMLNQYQYLLEQICADPARPLLAYSLVAPASRVLLPDPSVQIHEPLHGLTVDAIADWAQRSAAKLALYHDGKALSYGELWHAAQAIASAMRAHGLKRSDVVAISGPKCFGLIACMVAALLSGGVMLTLDRRFPAERQRLLVRETGAKQILYIGDFKPEDVWIRELDAATIIEIDAGDALPVHPLATLDRGASSLPKIAPDDPAYIFFTSGTTGVPKGILGSHKSLSHFLAWQRETFAIGPDDRVAQLTALSFDVLLRDVFLPLTGGASLHLPDEAEGLAPGYILPWLARERISVLHTVPALAQSWLADVPHDLSLCDLRWVFFSGEPLQDTLIKRWRSAFSHTGAIVNLYGPTETTLAKCFHRVIDEEPLGVQPVGRPLPQTQALVMSASNQRCGIGEPGEIVIRTPFRTLGYINAPDENRERFVKNQFRDDEQDLLYLTGDRGRYRPDGTLMMEGRLDDQVKINGVRVEPGEAGAILAQHEALEACFVMARKDDRGENFLAAYVVVKREVNTSEFRTFLSSKLPAPAVPSAFVFLDSLPLTANGKVDRKALPAPDNTRSIEPFVAPRTANEETLAAIWAEVLQLDRVGIHDNFFDLGGHSLLATQVMARVRATFQINVPLRALFESPTVAGLVASIVLKQAEGSVKMNWRNSWPKPKHK